MTIGLSSKPLGIGFAAKSIKVGTVHSPFSIFNGLEPIFPVELSCHLYLDDDNCNGDSSAEIRSDGVAYMGLSFGDYL